MKNLRIVMAQQGFEIGDIFGNVQKIIQLAKQAFDEQQAEMVVFSELCLIGYPPEDLLLRPSLKNRVDQAIEQLLKADLPCAIVIGLPLFKEGQLFNGAMCINDQKIVHQYHKQCLPNYQVFDEKRYFEHGEQSSVFDFNGVSFSILICEDIWFDQPIAQAKELGAQCILALNASPFHLGRAAQRVEQVQNIAKQNAIPVLYVNGHYAQDELVFDGASFVVNQQGECVQTCVEFEDVMSAVDLAVEGNNLSIGETNQTSWLPVMESLHQALVLGLKSYVNKNGFPGIVLGLSGGIDSGLSLAIAVDALGADRVHAVMMPFAYTSEMSIADAKEQADLLGVKFDIVPIVDVFEASFKTLQPVLNLDEPGVTEQNLQARIRGLMLMAISNKTGSMVLTTGNKSEMAVGYATLYGDMCGGYNALKDVPKTLVFELSRFLNTIKPMIPSRVIERPPSAELAPDQKDEDSLPPYDILDAIIEHYVEHDLSADAICAKGFDKETVYWVCKQIDRNEYKRRQAAEGVRITPRGFGRDRRYPITHKWLPGD
ncbi:NAD+ synthase [Marinicellulosiphila megalodicopiae]|uniref:NAD+ synthase n=1 Tax=Marinicellulosiphila megalodicopiae TaxID=2724896 RepID=UPI003BB0749F